jgi:hypothetical protein
MIILSQTGLAAAFKEIRSDLAAMSTGWINYNSVISDSDLMADMKKVITAYLNAAQPPKGPST